MIRINVTVHCDEPCCFRAINTTARLELAEGGELKDGKWRRAAPGLYDLKLPAEGLRCRRASDDPNAPLVVESEMWTQTADGRCWCFEHAPKEAETKKT